MSQLFYFSILFLVGFEICNIYFIMPMPGSQEINSIDIAFFLHHWRWIFRIVFYASIIYNFSEAFKKSKVFSILALLVSIGVTYLFNFKMSADKMFLQVNNLQFANATNNINEVNKLVIGIENNGQAKAYPIQFLGYHHQIFDSIGGEKIMITYCTVCRTARVFEPIVNGKVETFRLVGMDHFNAMFEDNTTKSWWRQATGEAIAGKLKGNQLPEFHFIQSTLKQWLVLHPNSLIMQPDKHFTNEYDGMKSYELGRSKSSLTKRDSLPWQRKSWIVGVVVGKESKAYDWIALKNQHIINDVVGNKPIVIVLKDDNSFFAYERKNMAQQFSVNGDTLKSNQGNYTISGLLYKISNNNLDSNQLKPIRIYQEYWHSWQTFHPNTKR